MKKVVVVTKHDNSIEVVGVSEVKTDTTYRLVLESPDRETLELPWTDNEITERHGREIAQLLGYSSFKILEEHMTIKSYQI